MFDKFIMPAWLIQSIDHLLNTLSRVFGFRIRVLSIVIFCGTILLTVKIGHLWETLKAENLLCVSSSFAEEKTPASAEPKTEAAVTPASSETESKKEAAQEESKLAKPETSFADINPENLTSEQYRALSQLSHLKPQNNVAKPDKETMLKAIETKIDEKIKKLEDTKSNLEQLVKSVEEKDKANLERLVKISESMKPEEAAKILETLELPVLMDLMEAIKPAKGAAILAVMEAPKAGYLMNELAKRKKLIKTQGGDQDSTPAPAA